MDWQAGQIPYGHKAVLNFYRKPEFAELGILRIFERDGWQGVWVDSYRGKFRTRYWPANSVTLPKDKESLLESIYEAAGKWAGCFDVFCWKGRNYIFAEAKQSGKDKIQDTQKRWLEAAIRCGCYENRFYLLSREFQYDYFFK